MGEEKPIWEGTFAGHPVSVRVIDGVAKPFIGNNPYMFADTRDGIMATAAKELAAERDELRRSETFWKAAAEGYATEHIKLQSAASDVVECWLPSDRAVYGPTMNGAMDTLAALLSANGASNG